MEHSAAHNKAIEILTTLGSYECEEYLAGKITKSELKNIASENQYDRHHKGVKNLAFEQCLANVIYG